MPHKFKALINIEKSTLLRIQQKKLLTSHDHTLVEYSLTLILP